MWFSPIIPQTGEAIIEANRVFDAAARTIPVLQKVPIFNLRPLSLPARFFERTFVMIMGFPITEDPALNKAGIKAFRDLIRIGADHG